MHGCSPLIFGDYLPAVMSFSTRNSPSTMRWCAFAFLAISAELLAQRPDDPMVITPGTERRLQEAEALVESAPDSALAWTITWSQGLLHKGCGAVNARLIEIQARARWRQSDMLGALDDCDSAMACYRSLHDSTAIARMEQLKGEILTQAGDFTSASVYLENALTYFTLARDLKYTAAVHRSLGILHYSQQQFARAWEHFHASRDLWLKSGDDKGLSRVYRSMGILAAEDCEPDSLDYALVLTDSARYFAGRVNDRAAMSASLGNMGLLYMHMKDTAMARLHNEMALRIAREIQDSLLIVSVLGNLGQLAIRYGDPSLTCTYCSLMLAFAERHHMLSLARDAVDCLTTGYVHAGKWQQAFHSTRRYFQLRDSTYNASSKEEILRRSLVAEAARREYSDSLAYAAERARLQSDRAIERLRADRNRSRAIAFGIGALLLLGTGGLLYRTDRKRRLERFERDAAQLEMQALRAQMNPHFIFNALNSINSYIRANDRDLASGFLTKFARLMRLVLENSRHAEVPLRQDLEALSLYMDLERSRMQQKFDYTVEVDPRIDQDTTLVPPLVLQPFVENAIWHGISRKEGTGSIKLSVQKKDARLVMTVEDDGVGRGVPSSPMSGSKEKTSLGASITRDRLAAIGKQRGTEAGFQFFDLDRGTRVEVVLPLVQDG